MAQIAQIINGTHTELLVQVYADRTLALLTQLGKVGYLVQASIPSNYPLPSPPPPPLMPQVPSSLTLTPLLGQPPSTHLHTLYSLYASQIAAFVWSSESKNAPKRPIIVGIALKKPPVQRDETEDDTLTEEERSLFVDVMKMLQQIL